MSFEKGRVRGVTNQYGARNLGALAGVLPSEGGKRQAILEITEETITAGVIVADSYIPFNAVIDATYTITEEAFVGTVDLDFGRDTDEAANGVPVAGTDIDALGKTVVTGSGDFVVNAAMSADTLLNLVVNASAITTYGKAKLVIEYTQVS